MLPPAIGIAGKTLSLTYIDPTHRPGLSVTLEIGLSIWAATAHPVLGGVYQVTGIVLDTGSYTGIWTVGAEPAQTQSVYIYSSEIYLHPVRVSVVDSDKVEMPGVTLIVSEWDGPGYSLVAYDVTGPDGEAQFSLGDGVYRLTLLEDGYVFNTNNHVLELGNTQEEYLIQVDGSRIAVPDITYTPPVGTVTMSVRLINLKGEPVPYRNVVVTCLTPAEHAEAIQFLALEGRTVLQTTVTGETSMDLIPGIEVEVAVANTSVIRRFTVPPSDFNLVDYLGNNDYFSVAQTELDEPERVS